MMLALLVTISNSDQISLRVRRTIPQPGIKRVLAFVFFNGAAGGLVWVAHDSGCDLFRSQGGGLDSFPDHRAGFRRQTAIGSPSPRPMPLPTR